MQTQTLKPILLTKREAASLLGVAVSTFDRIRVRAHLLPHQSAKLKPLLWEKEAVQSLGNQPSTSATNGAGGRILTIKEIKARAKGGKRK